MKLKHLVAFSVLWVPSLIQADPLSGTDNNGPEHIVRIEHPWSGKKVAFLGDSITDPNCYGDNIKKYWDFMKDWLGIEPYVYGISGREWNDVPNQAERLENEHGGDFDAIIIFLGTNDFNAGVPIGEWYTETEEEVMAAHGQPKQMQVRKKRTLVESNDTVKGRINIGLLALKTRYPQKQIVLLTPLHRALADFGETNVQPDQSYQNSCGDYIDAYVDTIKEAGNVWAVPVIDLSATSGLNPMVENQLIYFYNSDYDQLHPNTLGQQRMARTLMYQLLALPGSF